jgi:hypothetical protein
LVYVPSEFGVIVSDAPAPATPPFVVSPPAPPVAEAEAIVW